MKSFLSQIFSPNDDTSSKRIFGFIGLISLITYMFMYPSDSIIEIVGWVTVAYTVGTVVEKFPRGGRHNSQYGNNYGEEYNNYDQNTPEI